MRLLFPSFLLVLSSAASGLEVQLADITYPAGFRIDADTPYDALGDGGVGSAGDINGDGIGDFFFVRNSNEGAVLVAMGRNVPFAGPFGLDVANWGGGFSLRGSFGGGYVATAAAAGDVNGDGFDDLLFGAPWNFPHESGYACLLFGRAEFPESMTTGVAEPGTACFSGPNAFDNVGKHLSTVGDVDGDGHPDFVIAAPLSNNSATDSGSAYLVFGQPKFPLHTSLVNPVGVRVVRLDGTASGDSFGSAVAHADLDGDGLSDIAISAQYASGAGIVYVVYGRPDWPQTPIAAAEIAQSWGFQIVATGPQGTLGRSLASGDFNGDRLGDLVLGDGLGLMDWVGNAHILFGEIGRRAGTVNVSELDGSNGFTVTGIHPFDRTGEWVGNAGDFNGDGIEDFVLSGIYESTPATAAGVAHLIFGSRDPRAATLRIDELTGSERIAFTGSQASGLCGVSSASAGDIDRSHSHSLMISCHGEGVADQWLGSVYVLKGQMVRTIFNDGLEPPGNGNVGN